MAKKTLEEMKEAIADACADYGGGFPYDHETMWEDDWESLADTCAKLANHAYRLSCSLASYSGAARKRANEG